MSGLASPCINVCRMHDALGLCEGCARTIDEIAAWGQMAEWDKQVVWLELPERQARLGDAGVKAQPRIATQA